jgi:hypothetical protein
MIGIDLEAAFVRNELVREPLLGGVDVPVEQAGRFGFKCGEE